MRYFQMIWLFFHTYWLRRVRQRYIKRIYKGVIESVDSAEEKAWLSSLKECSGAEVYRIDAHRTKAIIAAPFILGYYDVPSYATDKSRYFMMLFTEDVEDMHIHRHNDGTFHEGLFALGVWKALQNQAKGRVGEVGGFTADIDEIVPLKVQIEFMQGVCSAYKVNLVSEQKTKRLEYAEHSKSLALLTPALKAGAWSSSHAFIRCPSCEGHSIKPKKDIDSFTTCPFCNSDIVVVVEDSGLASSYSLLEEEESLEDDPEDVKLKAEFSDKSTYLKPKKVDAGYDYQHYF